MNLLDHMANIDRKVVEELLSPTAVSNIFTMAATSTIDAKQALPSHYTIPPEETRRLRAKLILEEALETIQALGFRVELRKYKQPSVYNSYTVDKSTVEFDPCYEPSMEDIIDGCCDLHYVEVGTLCACGVPDVPHMNHVNERNNAKFPHGIAVLDKDVPGKFGKPEGWEKPNHAKLAESLPYKPNFGLLGELLHKSVKATAPQPSNSISHSTDGTAEIEVPIEHREHGNVQSPPPSDQFIQRRF